MPLMAKQMYGVYKTQFKVHIMLQESSHIARQDFSVHVSE